MLNYQDMIALARSKEPFVRIKLEGGQTEGQLKVSTNKRNGLNLPPPRPTLGKDYAEKIKKKDEKEEKEFESTNWKGGMSAVDELTSIGSIPDPMSLDVENLTQVYSNYSFDSKSDKKLVISRKKEDILDFIESEPVVIIKGPTGCGKTTQVPQYILDSFAKLNMHCNIVVTQPRRIAAMSVAKRVAAERNWPIGSIVGYQISLEKEVSEDTRLLYCTTGVLLQNLILQQSLMKYTHIIIDEIHERDSETDFLLIVLKKLLRAPGCRTKLILMSATMDTRSFVNYFSKNVNNCIIKPPVVDTDDIYNYPVQIYYNDDLNGRLPNKVPSNELDNPGIEPCAYDLACALIDVFHKIDEKESHSFIGSVLVFLPGILEIETLYEKLEAFHSSKADSTEKWLLCPLHSSVTFEEQSQVFAPVAKGCRKIILATNIAESSITVPDVKYVIDFCLTKIQIQDPDSSYSSLQLSWICQSQGTQRAGRVGRVMPGRVYRLVSKSFYENLNEDCPPEILRCPLDQLVLKAKCLRMGSPAEVLGRAMDPPDLSNLLRTVLNLKETGALLLTCNGEYEEDDGDLTFIGKVMASLPLDTRLSKLVLFGHVFGVLPESIVMASALSVKNIFSTPFKQHLEAYNSKLAWADSSCSDPITFIYAYKVWRMTCAQGKFQRSGGMKEKEWARSNFIQLKALKEVSRIETDIISRLQRLGIISAHGHSVTNWTAGNDVPLILKIILAGACYPNYFVGKQADEQEAVRILGGRDPFATVYLTNFPNNQPGALYAETIKSYFKHCGSLIDVEFDCSNKVYLTFGSSERVDSSLNNAVSIPGKIMLAVYRAIKLRQLQVPIVLPLFLPKEAEKKMKELSVGNQELGCWGGKMESQVTAQQLPGLTTSIIPLVVSHVVHPSLFWVQMGDETTAARLERITFLLNQPNFLIQCRAPYEVGSFCAAALSNGDPRFRRATIEGKELKNDRTFLKLHFIDYGQSLLVPASEVRKLAFETGEETQFILKEPGMAIRCTLAEVQPGFLHNANGCWSPEVVKHFKEHFLGKEAIGRIYSVVNNVMSLYLFSNFEYERPSRLTPNVSFNYYLVKKGFAQLAEEPFLSREDYLMRKSLCDNPSSKVSSYASFTPKAEHLHSFKLNPQECRMQVTLKGPRSPLEMNLHSLARKSLGKNIGIEHHSVNSVLLDPYPMDPHERLIVATSVSQNVSGDRLTLRNTTLMPNIHGLSSLCGLIFAPRVELRTNEGTSELTGAICGLGYDSETLQSYNPENDIELVFDTQIDLNDIENINRLRFWMNYIVSIESEGSPLSRARVAQVQENVRKFLLILLSRERRSKVPLPSLEPYEWGTVPPSKLLGPVRDPSVPCDSTENVYSLIWGIDLNEPLIDLRKCESVKKSVETLEYFARGIEPMRSSVQCEACGIYLETPSNIRHHLQTQMHKISLDCYKLPEVF